MPQYQVLMGLLLHINCWWLNLSTPKKRISLSLSLSLSFSLLVYNFLSAVDNLYVSLFLLTSFLRWIMCEMEKWDKQKHINFMWVQGTCYWHILHSNDMIRRIRFTPILNPSFEIHSMCVHCSILDITRTWLSKLKFRFNYHWCPSVYN